MQLSFNITSVSLETQQKMYGTKTRENKSKERHFRPRSYPTVEKGCKTKAVYIKDYIFDL